MDPRTACLPLTDLRPLTSLPPLSVLSSSSRHCLSSYSHPSSRPVPTTIRPPTTLNLLTFFPPLTFLSPCSIRPLSVLFARCPHPPPAVGPVVDTAESWSVRRAPVCHAAGGRRWQLLIYTGLCTRAGSGPAGRASVSDSDGDRCAALASPPPPPQRTPLTFMIHGRGAEQLIRMQILLWRAGQIGDECGAVFGADGCILARLATRRPEQLV